MTFVFSYVFGRKWLTSFVFVSVSAENKMTFSSPVSFSAENVYTGFGRSLHDSGRKPKDQAVLPLHWEHSPTYEQTNSAQQDVETTWQSAEITCCPAMTQQQPCYQSINQSTKHQPQYEHTVLHVMRDMYINIKYPIKNQSFRLSETIRSKVYMYKVRRCRLYWERISLVRLLSLQAIATYFLSIVWRKISHVIIICVAILLGYRSFQFTSNSLCAVNSFDR